MRDLILLAILGGLVPLILSRPHIGILAYVWVSLMNPHRLTWGFASELPIALTFFALTIVAWLGSSERKTPQLTGLLGALLLFTAWFSLTTWFARAPVAAGEKYSDVMKMILALILVVTLIDRRERLRQYVWVVALSLGFYGVKGGLFVIASAGRSTVWGPPNTYIYDNNTLALALVMTMPLLWFLYETSTDRRVRIGLIGVLVLTALATVGTYSRGGLVGLLAMGAVLWLRSQSKLVSAIIVGTGLTLALLAMPAEWYARMATIESAGTDESFNVRLVAWSLAQAEADQRPMLGGGFRVFTLNKISHGASGSGTDYLNAHSIYFEVLGEHGYAGLAIFIILGITALIAAQGLIRAHRQGRADAEIGRLGAALQVSLVGYAVAGAFLNMAFYDLYYFLIGMIVVATAMVRRGLGKTSADMVSELPVAPAEASLGARLLAGTWRGSQAPQPR